MCPPVSSPQGSPFLCLPAASYSGATWHPAVCTIYNYFSSENLRMTQQSDFFQGSDSFEPQIIYICQAQLNPSLQFINHTPRTPLL